MRSRQLAVLLLVTLVVTSGVAMAKARGEPELSVFAPDNKFTPGEEATLDLYVQNAGEVAYATSAAEQARVTTARDVVVTIDAEDAPVEVETANGERAIGNVPEGVSSAVSFDISVDEAARPGTYEIPVEVEYRFTRLISSVEGVYNEDEVIRRFTVDLVIEDDARFRVAGVDATDLYPPSGPLTLSVENVGTATAREASLAVASGTQQLTFGDEGTAETFVGDWAPGETRTVTVEATLADGADRRSYPLSATVSYEGPDGEPRSSDNLSAGVTPPAGSRFAVQDVASSLVVGEEGTVTGTVVNNGGSAARGAVLVIETNSPNIEPLETEYALGDLPAGGTGDFSFDAEVSEAASGGPRQLTFTVEYRDRNDEERESRSLDATVAVGDQRDVFAVEPVGASLRAGASGELRLDVTNQGDEPVTDVSAKLFANSPLATDDDEAFIDRLGPGETRTVVFGISASGSALSKTYPVSLDFQYDDESGDTLLSDTYQVPVQVTVPAGDDGGLPVLPIVAVLVVLVAGGVLLYRRRRSG